MRKRRLSLIILMPFILILWGSQALSLEKETHRAINEVIANKTINGFSLNNYLINQLGFKEGINEKLSKNAEEKRVFEWLGEGGVKEDEPDGLIRTFLNKGRSNNHFHNPLRLWNEAGLDN